jgi:hypothetical protein
VIIGAASSVEPPSVGAGLLLLSDTGSVPEVESVLSAVLVVESVVGAVPVVESVVDPVLGAESVSGVQSVLDVESAPGVGSVPVVHSVPGTVSVPGVVLSDPASVLGVDSTFDRGCEATAPSATTTAMSTTSQFAVECLVTA